MSENTFKILNFKAGNYVAVAGQKLDCFYIVHSGLIKCAVAGSETEIDLKAGDFFGLEACLMQTSSEETTFAETDCVLICVTQETFIDLLKKLPSVGIKIMNYFSKALREIEKLDSEYLAKGASNKVKAVKKEDAEDADLRILQEAGAYFFGDKTGGDCAFHIYTLILEKYESALPDDFKTVLHDRLKTLTERGNTKREPFPMEMTSVKLEARNLIFAEGAEGKHLFIIDKGSVDIFKLIGKKKVVVAKLEEGAIFGEMALLESKPRSAGAMASEEGVSMTIVPQGQFETLIEKAPQLGVRLATMFSERIRSTRRKLMNRLIEEPIARVYDMLLLELEKLKLNLESTAPYILNLSGKELCEMAGVSNNSIPQMLRKISDDKNISFHDTKISITSLVDVKKKTYNELAKATATKRSRPKK